MKNSQLAKFGPGLGRAVENDLPSPWRASISLGSCCELQRILGANE